MFVDPPTFLLHEVLLQVVLKREKVHLEAAVLESPLELPPLLPVELKEKSLLFRLSGFKPKGFPISYECLFSKGLPSADCTEPSPFGA